MSEVNRPVYLVDGFNKVVYTNGQGNMVTLYDVTENELNRKNPLLFYTKQKANGDRYEVCLGTLDEVRSRTKGTSDIKDKKGNIIGDTSGTIYKASDPDGRIENPEKVKDPDERKINLYAKFYENTSGGKRKTHRNKKSKKVRKSKSRKNRRKTARR